MGFRSKLHVIYYNWPNLKGNHAGMVHFFHSLKKDHPNYIKLIEVPNSINKWNKKLQRIYFYYLVTYLKLVLAKNDKLFFLEFLGNVSGNQTGMALKLRQWHVKNEFIGLVNISLNHLMELYDDKNYIIKAANSLDKIMAMGSGLVNSFSDLGFKNKMMQLPHFVDTEFYIPGTTIKKEKLQIIHIGSLKRNFKDLAEIAKECENFDFHVCQGLNDLSSTFQELPNVKLYPYLKESELLALMQSCHVSLSVFGDTLGSNVITTSFACGLINVVSDVGSIRDYCSENNSILCRSNLEFVTALNKLSENRKERDRLSKASYERSKEFAIGKIKKEFLKILD